MKCVQTIISIISYHIQQLLRTLLLSPVCTAMKIRKKIKDAFLFFISVDCTVYGVTLTLTLTATPGRPGSGQPIFAIRQTTVFFFVSSCFFWRKN